MKTTYFPSYFHDLKLNNHPLPDNYITFGKEFVQPDDDFIICRNKESIPTAVYGNLLWDLSPYKTTNSISGKFDFNFIQNLNISNEKKLILTQEMKKIFFGCIYLSSHNSKLGRSSLKTLSNRFNSMKHIINFIVSNSTNVQFDNLTILSILSNEYTLSKYIRNISQNQQNELSNLINQLSIINNDYLQINLVHYNETRSDSEQFPVIPSRIYLYAFKMMNDFISEIYPYKDSINEFIKLFKNPLYGLSKSSQLRKYKTNTLHPDFKELVEGSPLKDLFMNNNVLSFRHLTKFIKDIQITCKFSIHNYTAMRDNEVLSMEFNPIDNVNIKSENHKPIATDHFINIISATSKFTGYKQKSKWLCPIAVKHAIEILQSITSGVAYILDEKPENLPLFQSASTIFYKKKNPYQTLTTQNVKPMCLENIKITEEDRIELLQTDLNRSFSEDKFLVGNCWDFTSHQFRRSLAFYGANSNLISESTGATLFKHLSHEMQRYYRRGSDNILTIFGNYDKKSRSYIIPKNHFFHEYQSAITSNKARELISNLFSDTPLYGKRGKYIEKQKFNDDKLNQEVNINENKEKTMKMFHNGEISFKKTLLGGCLKSGKCDLFMLGKFTGCLTCKDAALNMDKIDDQIIKLESQAGTYEHDSAEYQLVSKELGDLKLYSSQQKRK